VAGEDAHVQWEQQKARIARLEGALVESDTKLAERDAKLAERDAKLAELMELVGKLTGQIEKLTEQLGQNSKNSHRPPSSDGPGSSSRSGKAGKRPGSGLKRGGQKGHRGSYHELLPAVGVDQFIDMFAEVCLSCAHRLSEIPGAAACRYQQLDLREHRPHVVEFRRHEVQCERCGIWTRASHDRIPSSAFGPCLTAVVGMLTGAYHLSRRSAQKLLRELFGISISLGAISGMEGRAAEALKHAYAEAEHEVQYARVKHADATEVDPIVRTSGQVG
jgi:transposase